MSHEPKRVLIIGGPATGKTHYGVQLYGRLSYGESQLTIRNMPETLTIFEDGLDRLGQGVTASHTATETYETTKLSFQLPTGHHLDLIWPDYGGEQINQIIEYRQISPSWQQRLLDSNAWLLFIRLNNITKYEDSLSRPPEVEKPPDNEKAGMMANWSDSAFFIELLQIFLYIKEVGTINRIKKLPLVILLSCWDEISDKDETTEPQELLLQRMPLFFDFVKSVWSPKSLSIWGLSSLGKALSKDEPDMEYITEGPESKGYVILPAGSKSSDLTLPVANLMEYMI